MFNSRFFSSVCSATAVSIALFSFSLLSNSSALADERSPAEIVAELNRSEAKLPAEFEQDFTTGMPPELFLTTGDDTALELRKDGIHTEHNDRRSLDAIYVCMQIHGDFDIEATFADLELKGTAPDGYAGIGLGVFLQNRPYEYVAVVRRTHMKIPDRKITFSHGTMKSNGSRQWLEHHRNEAVNSGRLRLARRGNRIYGLYAAAGANDFQLINEFEVTGGHVGVQGLRIVTEAGRQLEAAATWKQLKVSAAKITGGPIKDSQQRLDALNAADADKNALLLDLADEDQVDEHLQFDDTASNVRELTDDGLRISLLSQTGVRSAHVQANLKAGADFDVTVDLEVNQLESPDPQTTPSELGIQIFLKHDPPNSLAVPDEVSLFLRPEVSGQRTLIARCVSMNGTQKIYRAVRKIPVDGLRRLRIAFHDNRILYLYADANSDSDIVFAELQLSGAVSATSVDLYSSAKGRAFITDVTWKSLSVRTTPAEL